MKPGEIVTADTELSRALIDVEDDIIMDFCEKHGGLEYAMPMVRKQFELARIDFRKPTEQGLRDVIKRLEDVSLGLKGADFAKDCRRNYLRILNTKLQSLK